MRSLIRVAFVAVFSLFTWTAGDASWGLVASLSNANVLSVSFLTPTAGWMLASQPCATSSTCVALYHTKNAGVTWTASALPRALTSGASALLQRNVFNSSDRLDLSVRFSNANDGWIWGALTGTSGAQGPERPVVWSTHNGGVTWSSHQLPGLGGYSAYLDLEASSKAVYVLAVQDSTFATIVDLSPVGADHWARSSLAVITPPAGGTAIDGAITLRGASGWLSVGNDRGETGGATLSSSGQWTTWKSPCADVGDTWSVPEASSPSRVAVVCQLGGFGSFSKAPLPPGARLESTWLYLSTNGGRTFHALAQVAASYQEAVTLLAMPSASTVFVRQSSNATFLRASFDGGQHWQSVFHGDVTSLQFVTPSEGWGIVSLSSTRHELITSSDGGHTWRVAVP